MDAIEKFVADTICKVAKITDPAKVAAVEAEVPTLVNAAISIVELVKTIRTATTPAK